jgi:pimeloyl-ACP methyl ester carboxylesterase
MKTLILLALAIFISSINLLAYPKVENASSPATQCGSIKISVPWKYCVSPGSPRNSGEVLYYLHGGGGNEESWEDKKNYTAEIKKYWVDQGYEQPTVVAVSFGSWWLLASKNSRELSGLYDVFRKEVMPTIENQILPKKPTSRILLGESMGGYNSARLILSEPKLFKRAALVCPALDVFLPASDDDIAEYRKRTGATAHYAKKGAKLAAAFFDTPEAARMNSPMALLQKFSKFQKPLYVSCGDKDEYGFYQAAARFAQVAKSKGSSVTWVPLPGGKHCDVEPLSVARFLTRTVP